MNALNWQTWLQQGRQYETAGAGTDTAASKLSPVVVYNLFSMALESYCMAILDYHGTLADNHTFTDLLDSLERVCPMESGLKRRILDLEKFQQICAFDDMVLIPVDAIVNREFRAVIGIVNQWAHAQCRVTAA